MKHRIVICLALLAIGALPVSAAAQQASAAAELAVAVPFAAVLEERTLRVQPASDAGGTAVVVEVLVRANAAWRLEAPAGTTLRLIDAGAGTGSHVSGVHRSGGADAAAYGPAGGPHRVLLEWHGEDAGAPGVLRIVPGSAD